MAKIYQCKYGTYISHKLYLDSVYNDVGGQSYMAKEELFHITNPYRIAKVTNKSRPIHGNCGNVNDEKFEHMRKEQENIKTSFHNFMRELDAVNLLEKKIPNLKNNYNALNTAELVYKESGRYKVENACGANIGTTVKKTVNQSVFLFPENSKFYVKDVMDIDKHLQVDYFDFILLDPPWWNKYIRRKRKKSDNAYNMMFNEDLKNIPIENFLKQDGLVAVWCTNSEQNFNYLVETIFPKWNIKYIGKWYWMKITEYGEPVCPFSEPPGKQPYEKIVFGCRDHYKPNLKDGQLVVSIPSAIHSHKPPLTELIQEFLPTSPMCLEIFARYLLPRWTSYGNEVLRLQHESLFNLK